MRQSLTLSDLLNPRRVSTVYVSAVILGYVTFALVGFASAPLDGRPLSAVEAEAALAFAFPNAEGVWSRTEGTSSHSWLFRRAYVQGHSGRPTPSAHSEQVLKVGWPFTAVRGFIRSAGHERRTAGASFLQGDATGGPIRFMPIQPVWPGLIFNSVWIAALLLVIGVWLPASRRRTAALI
jgi:hypothetical protein